MDIRSIRLIFFKELQLFLRDKKNLAIFLLALPLMMIAFGSSTGRVLGRLDLAVVDEDASAFSNSLVRRFNELGNVNTRLVSDREAEDLLTRSKADAVLFIPKNFGSRISGGSHIDLQLRVDDSFPDALVAARQLQSGIGEFTRDLTRRQPGMRGELIGLSIEPKYGGNTKRFDYTFTVLAPAALLWISMTVMSLSVVVERLDGTLSRLLKTPITKTDIVLGKILFNSAIGILPVVVALFIALVFYNLTIKGDFGLVFVVFLLTVFAGLNLGIFFSIWAKTEKQASQAVTSLNIMIIVLGGILQPVKHMPTGVQVIAQGLPTTYAVDALRALIIKGSDSNVAQNIAILLSYGLISLVASLLLFRASKD